MTEEQWNSKKPGDVIRRGYDNELLRVLNVNKGKNGKPNELDLKPLTPPASYTAKEPKAYEESE